MVYTKNAMLQICTTSASQCYYRGEYNSRCKLESIMDSCLEKYLIYKLYTNLPWNPVYLPKQPPSLDSGWQLNSISLWQNKCLNYLPMQHVWFMNIRDMLLCNFGCIMNHLTSNDQNSLVNSYLIAILEIFMILFVS